MSRPRSYIVTSMENGVQRITQGHVDLNDKAYSDSYKHSSCIA